MRAVGITATTVMGAVFVGAVIVGVMSIPDIRRYFKVRNM